MSPRQALKKTIEYFRAAVFTGEEGNDHTLRLADGDGSVNALKFLFVFDPICLKQFEVIYPAVLLLIGRRAKFYVSIRYQR